MNVHESNGPQMDQVFFLHRISLMLDGIQSSLHGDSIPHHDRVRQEMQASRLIGLAVLILLSHYPFACKEEIFRPTSVWSWSGLSGACPGAARRRAHPCRCGTGCQPTDAGTCQYCRRPLPGTWRWRKTCTQPRPGYCALPRYCRHSPLAGCAITGSGKWLQACAHSGSVRSSQPEPIACSYSTGGGAMVDLQNAYADPPCGRITACSPARWTCCERVDTGAPRPSLRAIPDGGIVRLRRQCRVRRWAGVLVGQLQALRHHRNGLERLPHGLVAGWWRGVPPPQPPRHEGHQAHPREQGPPRRAAQLSRLRLVRLSLALEGHACGVQGLQRLLPLRQAALGHGLLHLPAVKEAVRERRRLVGDLQRHPARGSVMGLQHLPELLEDTLQLGKVVSRVARGPAVVRPGAVALGSGGLAHAVLLRGLSLLGFVIRLCDVLRVSAFPAHPRRPQWLQAAALLAGLRLPNAPLREFGLRLLPARPRPGRVLELDAQEQLAPPPGLPQRLRRQEHQAWVVGERDRGSRGLLRRDHPP